MQTLHDNDKSLASSSARLLLIISMIFLQEGFTYYISFQIFAVIVLAGLVWSSRAVFRFSLLEFAGFLAFAMSVMITALLSPSVIATNSSNIAITAIGVLIYAAAILCFPLLHFGRPERLLVVLRLVSSAVILLLVCIMAISESTLVAALGREAMIQQNSRLIDNFSDADAISLDQAFRALSGENERIDLFYGEPSFLAIVVFACLGCYMMSSKLLMSSDNAWSRASHSLARMRLNELAPYAGVLTLLYIQSFSSIIYAAIVVYFLFVKQKLAEKRRATSLLVLAIFGIVFAMFSYDYLMYRLTMGDSLSFAQRFGFLFELSLTDLLTGVRDVAMLPEVGIHNGLFYIVAISGVGGLAYLLVLFSAVYRLAAPIKLAMFAVLLVLAIMMQNGGVFTPNKVVLFGIVLLPLACSRTIHRLRQPLLPAESSFD